MTIDDPSDQKLSSSKYSPLLKLLAIISLVILLIFSVELWTQWQYNLANLFALNALMGKRDSQMLLAAERLSQLEHYSCHAAWLQSLLYKQLGQTEKQDQYMQQAILCNPGNIPLVRVIAPYRLDLAEYAVNEYPRQASAWFWLADRQRLDTPEQAVQSYWQGLQINPNQIRSWQAMGNALSKLETDTALRLYADFGLDQPGESEELWNFEAQFIFAQIIGKERPEEAIDLYQRLLELRPHDGVLWRELGDLLVEKDPYTAIDAYLQSCYKKDPGAHGCYNAGRTAENLGDLHAAIRYYRLSKWSGALERADTLEAQLKDSVE